MKLYEINQQIQLLADGINFDPETGEIICDLDQMEEAINALQMERKSVLSYLAKIVLNMRAEEEALKAEEQRLKERRDRLAKKEDKLMQILDRECAGQKTDLDVATFSYRKTSRLEVSDAEKAIKWLKRNKLTTAYRVPAPEISKTEVKKLINAGTAVPGCQVVEDYSCSLK